MKRYHSFPLHGGAILVAAAVLLAFTAGSFSTAWGVSQANITAVRDALNQIKNQHMGLLPPPPDPEFANNSMVEGTYSRNGVEYHGFAFGDTVILIGGTGDNTGGRTFRPTEPGGTVYVGINNSHIKGKEMNAKRILMHELVHVGQFRDSGSGVWEPDGEGGYDFDPGGWKKVRYMWEVEAYLVTLKLLQVKLKEKPERKNNKAFKKHFRRAIINMQYYWGKVQAQIKRWKKNSLKWSQMKPLVDKYINKYAKLFCQKKAEWYSWDGQVTSTEKQHLAYYMRKFGLDSLEKQRVKHLAVNFWRDVFDADGTTSEEEDFLARIRRRFGIVEDLDAPMAEFLAPVPGPPVMGMVMLVAGDASGAEDIWSATFSWFQGPPDVYLIGVDEDPGDEWFGAQWDTTQVPNGAYNLSVQMEDIAGNVSLETVIPVIVSNP